MQRILLFLSILIFVACTEKPCEDVNCVNGYCEDGNCFCDDGFVGESCELETPPLKVLIKDIRVSLYPLARPDGSTWDSVSEGMYPDVRAGIRRDSTMLWTSFIWWADANDLTLEFGITPDLPTEEIFDEIELVLFDVDQDGDEEMISYTIEPYHQNGDGLYAPSIGYSGSELDFTLFMDYEF